jgi:hypothetical protein
MLQPILSPIAFCSPELGNRQREIKHVAFLSSFSGRRFGARVDKCRCHVYQHGRDCISGWRLDKHRRPCLVQIGKPGGWRRLRRLHPKVVITWRENPAVLESCISPRTLNPSRMIKDVIMREIRHRRRHQLAERYARCWQLGVNPLSSVIGTGTGLTV